MQICNLTSDNYFEIGKLLLAVIAVILSYIELQLHKRKERNGLMSQLNERYLNNYDIQSVIKYLREIDPTDEEPSAYQVELFLRFFEELDVHLRHGNLNPDDVKTFFNFYFDKLYHTERGKGLLSKINHEDESLVYLNGYKEKVEFK